MKKKIEGIKVEISDELIKGLKEIGVDAVAEVTEAIVSEKKRRKVNGKE